MIKEILPLLIPIIAITLGCTIPLLAIFLGHRKRKEMFALYHEERMAAIEKGIELPPLPEAFFKEEGDKGGKPKSPHQKLLVGLVWLFLGLACFVTNYLVDDSRVAQFTIYGLFPLGIGLAYLIYYFAVGKKEAEVLEAERKAKAEEINRSSTI